MPQFRARLHRRACVYCKEIPVSPVKRSARFQLKRYSLTRRFDRSLTRMADTPNLSATDSYSPGEIFVSARKN